MEVVKPGYEYRLINFSDKTKSQTLKFISKEGGVIDDGTYNEEVISALLNRFYHLQSKQYSKENTLIITFLTQIKDLLRKRLERKAEFVKNKQTYEKAQNRN